MTDLTKPRLLALRAIAEAATQGEWTTQGDDSLRDYHQQRLYRIVPATAREARRRAHSSARPNYVATVFSAADAAHFAALGPPTVLALLDLIDAYEAQAAATYGVCLGDCGDLAKNRLVDEDGLCLACGGDVVCACLGDAEAIVDCMAEQSAELERLQAIVDD